MNMLKSRFSASSMTMRVYLYSISFSCCFSRICEIPRNSPKIRTYSSSKSSKVIDLGVNRNRICDFLLVIKSNFGRIVFETLLFKPRKRFVFSPHPCLTPRSRERPLEFQDENYHGKTTVWYKFHYANFNRF